MFGLLRAMGNGGVVPPTPPIAQAPGTGGRLRRRFELDFRRPQEEPKRREPRRRRTPEVRVALSLVVPLPVLLVEVQVAILAPVAAKLALPSLAAPSLALRVQVTSRLGLAEERIDDLEAVLAAVLED